MPFVTLTSCVCVFVLVHLRQTSHSHVPHCVWLGRSDCHFLSSSRLISSLPLSVTQVKPIQKPLLSHPLLTSLKDCFLMQIMKRTFHPASQSIVSHCFTRDLIEGFMYLYCTTPRAPIYVIIVLNAWDWWTCLNMSGWTLEKLQLSAFPCLLYFAELLFAASAWCGFIAFSHNTWKIFGLKLGVGTDPCIRNRFWCKSLSNQIFCWIEFYLYGTVAQFPQGIVWIHISRYAALNNFCYTAY